jgi:hypothetical protein
MARLTIVAVSLFMTMQGRDYYEIPMYDHNLYSAI